MPDSLPVFLLPDVPLSLQTLKIIFPYALTLATVGFEVSVELTPCEPELVLPALIKAQGAALLVMGAYGHSRIRQLIVGSTTTTLLRLSDVPVLILR